MNQAKFIKEIIVDDNTLSLFEHIGGGIFAIDSSFIEQCFDDDEQVIIGNPFNNDFDKNWSNPDYFVELIGL
jgi:hypothetical protein